jgi:opacity protein-like surface antigen
MRRVRRALCAAVLSFGFLLSFAAAARAQDGDSFEFEFAGGATQRLQGSRAVVSIFDGRAIQTADSGERPTLPMVGLNARWMGRTFGTFLDVSWVDGGTVAASIGSNTSDVKSSVLDFHSGFQAHFASGRVRPYVLAGGGFARASTDITLTLFGQTVSAKQAEWLSSLVYGGGVRIGLSDTVGMRVGVEGVSVAPLKSDSMIDTTSYGRFIVGVSFASRREAPATPAPPVLLPPAPRRDVSLPPATPRAPAAPVGAPDPVQRSIDEIRGRPHGTIPAAQATGRSSGGATTIAVTNATVSTLSVFLSGPQSESLTLAPGATGHLRLTAGDYEMAARVSAPDVIPFYGTQRFAGGTTYAQSFYIVAR